MFHCLHIVSNWHKGFGLANSVKTIWCWLRARLSQCLTTSGWNCPSLQYPFQTSNKNMDVCVFVRCLFVFFEGMLTLSLGTIFAHMLPMCSFALSRAKGRANTKTKTVVPLSTVQLAIKYLHKEPEGYLEEPQWAFQCLQQAPIAFWTCKTRNWKIAL